MSLMFVIVGGSGMVPVGCELVGGLVKSRSTAHGTSRAGLIGGGTVVRCREIVQYHEESDA